MKKLLAVLAGCLVIVVILSNSVSAQEPKKECRGLESVAITSGDSPIASGITVSAWVVCGRLRVEAAFQHEQAWIITGYKLGKLGAEKTPSSYEGFAGLAVGHFQGAPWGGPYLSIKKRLGLVSISTLQWPGVYVWQPRSREGYPPNTEWALIGYVMVYQVDIGPVGIFYSGLDYLDDKWNHLPGISITKKLWSNFSLSGTATWNNNRDEWMFLIGATWEPKR